ncbi:iron uptake transporter deferrochelatase/peroxidase subunit [uncultured Methylovirgula sp.]|uniref:iron uptake transporter deferrochelatase/peroxidase subunit n=1 Tax=uncultured Methylovirgula sp. TaxID=1285960 RepID=UPI0026263159|nr:iron uptake transporter deferrochelatase/peroxidase subunit [uncultured Methylovirgula sp.]
MSKSGKDMNNSRRNFLVAAGGALAAGGIAAHAPAAAAPELGTAKPAAPSDDIEPFYGLHQSGIATPAQTQTYFAVFDLQTEKVDDVKALLRRWTDVAARLSTGTTDLSPTPAVLKTDSGEALGLGPSRLTLTFGFGAGLFDKAGKDRYGLKSRKPEALIDLPYFNGDQLIDGHTGGDLSVQACANNPQVAFHAVRQLAREAQGIATIRWAQSGFSAQYGDKAPRNLMGFKDGTINPATPIDYDRFVWAGDEGPAWMRGGSYVVARVIRIALEHWDRMDLDYQEQTIGRHKFSGAPLGGAKEADPLDLSAADKDGNPLIPATAHARIAAAQMNDGMQILRRGYSYNNGATFVAERWPPWHQGIEYDAGSLFVCYQRDPRTGFVKIFDKLSKLDAMNQFITHIGSGVFACPPGIAPGGMIGERLFGA